jgi:hypothetical protein
MVSKGYLMLRSAKRGASRSTQGVAAGHFRCVNPFPDGPQPGGSSRDAPLPGGPLEFSRGHEHVGGAFAESFFSELNFSTYCKTTHT